jgi:hypothetical protein
MIGKARDAGVEAEAALMHGIDRSRVIDLALGKDRVYATLSKKSEQRFETSEVGPDVRKNESTDKSLMRHGDRSRVSRHQPISSGSAPEVGAAHLSEVADSAKSNKIEHSAIAYPARVTDAVSKHELTKADLAQESRALPRGTSP